MVFIFCCYSRMTDRKKYRPKVMDTSEKMKRKKSCNDPLSSSKKKCNHPSSMDPTADPTSTNPTSFNLVDPTVNHPPSSSNPICNEEISFFNKDCKQWYENYINYRPLLLERGVLLDQLKEVGCDVIFSLHQWNSAIDIKKTDKTYNTLVKIFYSNMHDIDRDDYKFKSLVRNVSFEVTPELVSNILGVRQLFISNNTLTYPFKNFKDIPKLKDVHAEVEGIPNKFSESVDNPEFFQQDLTPKYSMLNLIVGYNIIPKGHTAKFGLHQAHLLYVIGKGICIDLPCLIVDEIISVQGIKDRRRCLSFPILIAKIMEDCGVVIHSSDTYFTPMSPIYGGTIKKSLGQGKKNTTQQPQPQVENEVEAEDDEAQTHDVPNSSTAGVPNCSITGVPNSSTASLPLDALQVYGMLLVRLTRKMEEFENSQNKIKDTQNEIKESLKRMDSRLDRIESIFMKSKEITMK
ncbi:unnamed protein product [Ilex paraguariensis]|uniref:Putative plant transposon protein domain-containing protein n=1 Tax=Ilex paraguariensis TaxID=185542 RepID=A0ABC8RSJ0_9AQUA